jgi:hypothetical protein
MGEMDKGMKKRRFWSCFNLKETEEVNDADTIRDGGGGGGHAVA